MSQEPSAISRALPALRHALCAMRLLLTTFPGAYTILFPGIRLLPWSTFQGCPGLEKNSKAYKPLRLENRKELGSASYQAS